MDEQPKEEVVKPEISISAASVADEVTRVRHLVRSYESISQETLNIISPKGLDLKHGSNLSEAQRLTELEYDPTFYTAGVERVQAIVPTIQEALETLRQFQSAWGFELSSSYKIILTRYGTGGSYDETTNEILMRTTRDGRFERDNPAGTPIHELTHFCVKHLVEKYQLSFDEKERLVDGITATLFPEIFDPENKISETERQARLKMLAHLPDMLEQMKQERESKYPAEILSKIQGTYPFLTQEEYESFMAEAGKLEDLDPLTKVEKLIELLHNPHALVMKKKTWLF